MHDHITGENICEKIIKCLQNKLKLSFTNLIAICSDGARNMTGIKTGSVTLLESHIGRKITKFHCILHLQVLCSKVLQFEHIISVVVKIVNYIRSNALKHRIFRTFLEDVHADYDDLLYHTEVRWLRKEIIFSVLLV